MNIHVDFDALGAIHAIETVGLHRTRTAIRRALLESCRLVQREARSRHRFIPRTGALEREIVYEVDGANLDGKIYFQMRRAPYAPFEHEPTGTHGPKASRYPIRPKRKKALCWASNGQLHFARLVMHPGSPADRFLYEAADRSKTRITAIFNRHIEAATRGGP